MACPPKEVLSRWTDGSLEPREAARMARHAGACDACRETAERLRAAVEWLSSAAEPGPSCLSADAMAAAIESGRAPAHVRLCPRCAAEWRAFQPERRATRRLRTAPAPANAWIAAAAVFLIVGILFLFANRQTQPGIETPAPVAVTTPDLEVRKPLPEAPRPVPPLPETRVVRTPEAPKPAPAPETPRPEPAPLVVAPAPAPVVPAPAPPAPSPTLVEPPRAYVALGVRSGTLSALSDGKWVKAQRFEEGMALRADGRTQIDFAEARVTLEGSSRFSLTKDDLALEEGTLSAEIAPGSKFALVLDAQRIEPQVLHARAIVVARPERFVVEEGSALWNGSVIPEGVEQVVKKGRLEAQRRRTLPAAARARETLSWRMDLSTALARKVASHIENLPEGRMLVSAPLDGSPYFFGQATFSNGGEEQPLFTVKPNTAIRFKYFMTQPGPLELVMKNATKDENFNRRLEPVLRQWTTVTLYARDVLANPGGKKVTCDVGDRYTGIGWFVGKPGVPSEIHLERVEILEIER